MKCPSVTDGIEMLLTAYTIEYHSAMRKREILPFETTQKDLEDIIVVR